VCYVEAVGEEHTVELAPGLEVVFAGCPADHISDRELAKWFTWYRWLRDWSKTPADFGVPYDRLDPRYPDAMLLIDSTHAKLKPKGVV
jgi:hypothetical protein